MSTAIQKLREETGAGVMDCKKALDEANGNFDLAKELIEKRGMAKAEKKAERATGAGILEAYIHNGRIGVLLELRTETDFVGRSEPIKELARDLALHISAMDPDSVDTLMKQPYVKDESKTVEEVIKGAIAKVGENLKVARFARYQI